MKAANRILSMLSCRERAVGILGRRLLGLFSMTVCLGAAAACGIEPLQSRVYDVFPRTIPSFGRTELTFDGVFIGQWSASSKTGTVVQNVDFSVWLQRLSDGGDTPSGEALVPLEDVTYVDDYLLTAWTPEGLAGGTYGVLMQDPRGHSALVDPGVQIEVNPGRPSHVVFLPDEKQWLSANSTLTLNMVALDDKNLTYPIAGFVTVNVQSPGIVVEETSLNVAGGVSYTDGQASFSGYLDSSGKGTVTIACEDPSTCTALPPFVVEVLSPPEWPGSSTVGSVAIEVVESYSALSVTLLDAPSNEHVPYSVPAGEPFRVEIKARGVNYSATDDDGEPPEVSGEVLLFDASGTVEYMDVLPESPQGCFASKPLLLQGGVWSGAVTCYSAVEEEKLFAVGPLQKYGESRPFAVVAADAARLEVEPEFMQSVPVVPVPRIVAGTLFWIGITPVDAFGNPTGNAVVGTPVAGDVTGSLKCSGGFDVSSMRFLDCRITRTGEGDVIQVTAGALEGSSPAFDVVAGDLAEIAFVDLASAVTAGETFTVTLKALDAYENLVESVGGTVVVSDDPEDPEIEPELEGGVSAWLKNGTGSAEMQLERAVEQTKLVARYGDYGGESQAFTVLPASAGMFRVDIPELTVVAGDPQVATVTAEDIYGNRVVGYDGVEQLTLTPIDTRLEGDTEVAVPFDEGRGEVVFSPIEATDTARLRVDDSRGVSGTSVEFQVLARPDVAGFAFVGFPGVLWLDIPFTLTLWTVDIYGNHVTDYEGLVQLDDWTGTLAPTGDTNVLPGNLVRLEAGEFEGTFTISRTATSDALVATDDRSGLQSASVVFPVYDLQCDDPPETTLSVGGKGDQAVACEQDSVDFSATGHSDYGVMDVVWTFGDGTVARGARTWETQHAYTAAGEYRPAVSAVDRRLCASWVEAHLFVGIHDYSPTGPMSMRIVQGSPPLVAGADDGSQIATIEVQATDCREDSASYNKSGQDGDGFVITVLPSLGNVEAGDVSDLPGIQYLLGPYSGAVQFNFSAGNSLYGGLARIITVFEVQDGQGGNLVLATGELDIDVENDRVPPYVVEFAPAGAFLTTASVVVASFSEPIRGDNLTDPAVVASLNTDEHPIVEVRVAAPGSDGSWSRWPLSGLALDESGRELSISLAQSLDLEHNAYQVEVVLSSGEGVPSITDLDGNALDGNWDGTVTEDQETGLRWDPFTWRFGRVEAGLPQPLQADCQVSEPVFSPDGQDGEGQASDTTVFEGSVTLRSGIRAFNVAVYPPQGDAPAISLFSPVADGASAAVFQLEWGGTGSDGQRLPNGTYTYHVNVIDVADNWMLDACTGDVEIRNPVDLGAFL